MATFHWDNIIYGPIKSRRLGNSLGINIMPADGKVCSFDCIYCECGWNKDGKTSSSLPTKEEFEEALEGKLYSVRELGKRIDSITFSGNGEPTMHPDFPEIIDITVGLRNRLYPGAKISVLSNSSQLGKPKVAAALKKTDNPILKIDSALTEYVNLINRPNKEYSLEQTIENIRKFGKDFILQTMFLKGKIKLDDKTVPVDCTSEENVKAWIKLVENLSPRRIMMYTIDRETPEKGLSKVSVNEMSKIAEPLEKEGFFVQIYG
ncbi:MAG: radical SAM protein [Bacteroidales bacterium]|jgi:wyosine [tRNA(Phe)-imidazoG37] synthetase (radical SAM superfamily)|nr:radical SAM protein [Bacteroidales bacterium]